MPMGGALGANFLSTCVRIPRRISAANAPPHGGCCRTTDERQYDSFPSCRLRCGRDGRKQFACGLLADFGKKMLEAPSKKPLFSVNSLRAMERQIIRNQ